MLPGPSLRNSFLIVGGWLFSLATLLLLVVRGIHADEGLPGRPLGAKGLEIGHPPERVRQLLGEPLRVSRQVFLLRSLEQWHYGPPHHLRLTFACPRGKKPSLRTVRVRGVQEP